MKKKTKTISMSDTSVAKHARSDGKTRLVLKDKRTHGLMLLVGTTGRAAWYLRRTIRGREKLVQLGIYREGPGSPIIMSLDDAKDEIHRLLIAQGAGGERQLERQREAERVVPTLGEVGEAWFRDNPRGLAERTLANMRSYWKHLAPLHDRRIDEIEPADVEELRVKVRQTVAGRTGYGVRTSNKVVELLGQLLDREIRLRRMQMANPAKDPAVEKEFDRRVRTVFLKGRQRADFIAALEWFRELPARWDERARDWRDAAVAAGADIPEYVERLPEDTLSEEVCRRVAEEVPAMRAWPESFENEFGWQNIRRRFTWRHNQLAADALWTALFTGARISNVLRMKWKDIDDDWVWHIPREETKTRVGYEIPLETTVLVPILEARRTDSPWVFPHPDTGEPVKSIKKSWAAIKRRAGVPELHIHDLRRTMGSVMFNLGVNQRQIQMALCHSDPTATEHYTHLEDSSILRANFTAAAQAMMGD